MGGFATPIGFSSSPFDLAGYESPPQSTLTSQLSDAEEQTATRSTAADIINSVGQILLGGIILARTPRERLPQAQAPSPAPPPPPAKAPSVSMGMIVFVVLVAAVIFLLFRVIPKGG